MDYDQELAKVSRDLVKDICYRVLAMIIRLSDISPKGLEIKDKISLTDLNRRMNEGRANEIVFLSEPLCDLKITRQINGLALTGIARTTYRQPCSRCADELEMPLVVPINLVLKAALPNDENSLEDDVGIATYSGEHIDLEPLLQEYIILATSPYLQPEQDANGKCLLCGKTAEIAVGQDSTAKINLGSLLKGVTKK